MEYINDRRAGRTNPDHIGVTQGRASLLAGAAAKFGWKLYELPGPLENQGPQFVPNRRDRRAQGLR